MLACRAIAGPLAALALLLAPATATAAAPVIGAPSAIVIDARTGDELYAKNADDRRAIASLTKLMTAMVTLSRTKPGEVFEMPPYASMPAESKLGLQTGEQMNVRDLLRAMMLPSANDAAHDLAVNVGGSREGFVRLMNEQADALALRDTNYSTPVGLDDPDNYSTARDLSRLTARLLTNKTFARVADMERATLESGAQTRTIVTRNDLLLRYPFVTGVKTGHTIQAGYVLVASATGGNGAKVVSVVLGTPSESARDADSLALLRWGVEQFRRLRAVVSGRQYALARVRYHDDSEVGVVAARGVRLTTRRGRRVSRRVDAPEELEGPLAKGTRVGTLSVVYDGRVIRRVPLVTATRVKGAGFLRKATASLGGPAPTLALLLLVGVAAALLGLRIRANRGMRGERAAR